MATKKMVTRTLAETARSHCELCRYYLTVGKPTSLFFKVAAGDNRPRWKDAAESGSPDAQYLLGSCLRYGYGGPKDIRGSRKLFEEAAVQGHALGQYCLGVTFQEGFTGPKDFTEAAAWFRKAAEQGLAEAQFALVAMYCKRIPADGLTPEAAMDLLKQAASQGHEAAKAKLEQALKEGGIAQEPPEERNPGKVTLQGVLREMIPDHIKAAMTEAILSGGAKDKPTNDLMTAASKNELDIARACIEAGADVNGCTPSGATSLILAAGRGHREMVKLLLDSGADCNVKDGVSEATALHEAAIGDHVEIVRMLVAAGAAADARDDDDRTPLFNGSVAVAEVLVKAGADVNATSKNGRTVLHGTSDVPLTEFLLKNGADINAVDKRGRTPLYEAVRDENEAKVRVLLENGASPQAKDASGVTPLDLARKPGRERILRLFGEYGK